MNDTENALFEQASDHLRMAKKSLVQGEIDSAREQLDASLDEYPSLDGFLLRASVFVLHGEASGAWQDYQQLVHWKGDSEDTPLPEEEVRSSPQRRPSSWRSYLFGLAAAALLLGSFAMLGVQQMSNASMVDRLAVVAKQKAAAIDDLGAEQSRYRLVAESNRTGSGIEQAAIFTSRLDPRTPEFFYPTGIADVQVENTFLPVIVSWKLADDHVEEHVVGVGKDMALDLPTGNAVTLSVRPLPAKNWAQPYGLTLTRDGVTNYQGSTVGNTILTLEDGDRLFLQMATPSPPWNATLLLIRDRWALLTLERPDPLHKINPFVAGEPDFHGQPFPNTMVVWATVGTEAMARELADYMSKTPIGGRDQWGKWRGRFNTSIALLNDGESLPAALEGIPQEELALEIEYALERMRTKRNRFGVSINELLEQADLELKSRPELAKKIDDVLSELDDE